MLSNKDRQFYMQELCALEQEHQDLNEVIDSQDFHTKFSEFTIQKLKKRKLFLKDKIKFIKSLLMPDILA